MDTTGNFRYLNTEQVQPINAKQQKYLQAFRQNLLQGISYYEELVTQISAIKNVQYLMRDQLRKSKEELI